MKKTIITILLFVTCGMFIGVFNVFADSVGLGTDKSIYDLELLPGEEYSDTILVANQSGAVALPLHIKMSLWNLDDFSDDIEFVTSEPTLNATKWFSFPDGIDYIMEPSQERGLSFKISVPKDASPGSYLVMMRLQAVLPDYYFTEQGPRTIPEIGILFFIKVVNLSLNTEILDYSAKITELSVKDPPRIPLATNVLQKAQVGVFERFMHEMTASVKNNGIYHFSTEGSLEIKNMFGKTTTSVELPSKIMLPNRERSFDIEIEKDQNFWQRNMRVGFYRAKMTLRVPGSDFPLIKTTIFWIFPWKLIGSILVVLFLVGEFRRRILGALKVLIGKNLSK